MVNFIALVITIIVLLILAGVSIGTITGENGILTQAQNAENRTLEAKKDEENKINDYENYINQYENGEIKNNPKVPNGFYPVEGTKVERGFVISSEREDDLNNSKGGNQYVWIPVDGILGEEGKTVQNAASHTYTETTIGNGNTVANDIDEFINSVRINGGYYIARFEASEGQKGKAESKYNPIKYM